MGTDSIEQKVGRFGVLTEAVWLLYCNQCMLLKRVISPPGYYRRVEYVPSALGTLKCS